MRFRLMNSLVKMADRHAPKKKTPRFPKAEGWVPERFPVTNLYVTNN
jgi:hypothetical protein